MLPSDPVILLSAVNTKLRDDYSDLDDLCAGENIPREVLEARLAAIGYAYDPARRQFV